MRIEILLAVATIGLLASCSSVPEGQVPARCSAGDSCSLAGVLELNSGGVGSAELRSAHCYDLALPREFYSMHLDWDGKQVVVAGRMLDRPTDPSLFMIEIEGRRIEGGGCGQGVLFVTDIRLRRGGVK